MVRLDLVKQDVKQLSRAEQLRLLDWLSNHLDDSAELTEGFKEDVRAGKADIAAGRTGVVRKDNPN